MIRRRSSRMEPTPARARPNRHDRHGRAGRSAVVRPPLPPLDSRWDRFDVAVGAASEFLRSAWDELREVKFEMAWMPAAAGEDEGIPRWKVDREAKTITLFRVPIERLGKLHREDDLHRRMAIEACVFRAAAEYLDRDPWDLGPERFH